MAAEGGDVDVAGNSIAGGGRLGDGRSGGQNALEETTRTSSGSAGVSRHWQSAAGEGQAAHAYGHDGGAAAAWNSWNSPSPYQAYRGRGGGGGGGGGGNGYLLQPRVAAPLHHHQAEDGAAAIQYQQQLSLHSHSHPHHPPYQAQDRYADQAAHGYSYGQARSSLNANVAANTHEFDVHSHSLLSTSPGGYFNFAPSTCLAASPHSLAALGVVGGAGGVGCGVGAYRGAAVVAAAEAYAHGHGHAHAHALGQGGLRSTPTGNRSLLLRTESIPEGESLDMGNGHSSSTSSSGIGIGIGRGDAATGGSPPPPPARPPGGASNLTVLMERQERRERELRHRGDGVSDGGGDGESGGEDGGVCGGEDRSSSPGGDATAAANAAAEALAAMALEGRSRSDGGGGESSSSPSEAANAAAAAAAEDPARPVPAPASALPNFSDAASASLPSSHLRSPPGNREGGPLPRPSSGGSQRSPGPGRSPLLQRGRPAHVHSPARVNIGDGETGGGTAAAAESGAGAGEARALPWAPSSLPNNALPDRTPQFSPSPRDVLPSAAAAAAHGVHHQYYPHVHPQNLVPPPQPVRLQPRAVAAAEEAAAMTMAMAAGGGIGGGGDELAACTAGRSAPSELLWRSSRPQSQHQPQYRRISSPLLGPAAAAATSSRLGARLRSASEQGKYVVRRCVSNRELGDVGPPPSTSAPLSTSPYAAMLYRKEVLEAASQQRLMESRLASLKNLGAASSSGGSVRPATPASEDGSSTRSAQSSSQASSGEQRQQRQPSQQSLQQPSAPQQPQEGRQRQRRLNNEARKNRRAQHNQAVVDDLCEIVADLALAEKRLLHLTGPFEEGSDGGDGGDGGNGDGDAFAADPAAAAGDIGGGGRGTTATNSAVADRHRDAVLSTVRQFLSDLPARYALGVETPSAVLVHMRLMAAARADDTRAAVHIANMDDGGDVRGGGGGGGGIGRGGGRSSSSSSSVIRLVTISCADCDGLLEFITKLLGTGGARVLDADVMLTTDCIVLDRFVVEMKGRLRLDKLQQYIENYLKESRETGEGNSPPSPLEEQPRSAVAPLPPPPLSLSRADSINSARSVGGGSAYGPLYFNAAKQAEETAASARDRLREEMQTAVPLSQLIGSSAATPGRVRSYSAAGAFHRQMSAPLMPATMSAAAILGAGAGAGAGAVGLASSSQNGAAPPQPPTGQPSGESGGESSSSPPIPSPPSLLDARSRGGRPSGGGGAIDQNGGSDHPAQRRRRQRRTLVNREAVNFGALEDDSLDSGRSGGGGNDVSGTSARGGEGDDAAGSRARRPAPTAAEEGAAEREVGEAAVPDADAASASSGLALALEQNHHHAAMPLPPLIPFDELMLIETLGSGRVSTIYRAAWQPLSRGGAVDSPAEMVALKVATVDAANGGMEHVEELRREADIASMLEHNNICSLVGVASDPECFCLAYEFCEGGSLLSLLSNSSRCYEYLPIALDIANGMAYLHSRNVIHRDLKPSNILLTRDNRAKIADFGMSVTNFGQELTAETGTYRWMAPEVIRHESYSSNADVYSFGVCLWQLITREVPFATLSPIQTAYAVAEGCRPEIPASTPEPLQRIIRACWDEDSHKRPSFTYIAMALADYAKMAFNPANVGAQTVQIANEMLANVQGNSTVNVDFTTPVTTDRRQRRVSMPNIKSRTASFPRGTFFPHQGPGSFTGSDVGLQI